MIHVVLLVLRAQNIEATRAFYEMLGMTFVQEQHGRGPIHYSTQLGDLVLEIYPGKDEASGQRIGVLVDDARNIRQKIPVGACLVEPTMTEQGWAMVLMDPDGRKVDVSSIGHTARDE
jgi:lactoylglutathione lyase